METNEIDNFKLIHAMLMNISDVAKYLKVSKLTIRRWIKLGTFPIGIKVSHKTSRWRKEDVDSWLKERQND